MSSERPSTDVDSPIRAGTIPPGTSILVAGPAMTGKRQLVFDIVGGSSDRTGIFVTTKRGAVHLGEEFLDGREGTWDLRFVDCVSRRRSFDRLSHDEDIEYVTSPSDMTGIGIAASGFMREFYHADQRARFGLHSLSTLLMYADLRRVFQFGHVMTGRIASSGFTGAFTLDTTTRDSETYSVLKGLFDALVEVRDEDDGPELRVRGADFGPRSWTEF